LGKSFLRDNPYIVIDPSTLPLSQNTENLQNPQNSRQKLGHFGYTIHMTVTFVPILQIDPPDPILRPFRESDVSFLELVDQITQYQGSFLTVLVRPRPGGRFQVVDGYRRLCASIKAGLKNIPVRIVELNDTEYLAAQIACNSQHKDTDWIDFAHHLERLRKLHNEEMTINEMATICNKSTSWIRKILKLTHLTNRVKIAAQRGEMPIGSAHWLARLPLDEQGKYVADAMTMPAARFERQMKRAVNDYREAVKQGNLDRLGVDDLRPMMRDLRIIEAELEVPTNLPTMIAAAGIENPIKGAILALKWAFRVDDMSISERKQKVLNQERQRINDAERRQDDRNRKQKSEKS